MPVKRQLCDVCGAVLSSADRAGDSDGGACCPEGWKREAFFFQEENQSKRARFTEGVSMVDAVFSALDSNDDSEEAPQWFLDMFGGDEPVTSEMVSGAGYAFGQVFGSLLDNLDFVPTTPPRTPEDVLQMVPQTPPLLGCPQTPPLLGPQTPPLLGCPQTPPLLGCPQTPPLLGCPQTPPLLGCPQTPPLLGCPQTPPLLETFRVPNMKRSEDEVIVISESPKWMDVELNGSLTPISICESPTLSTLDDEEPDQEKTPPTPTTLPPDSPLSLIDDVDFGE